MNALKNNLLAVACLLALAAGCAQPRPVEVIVGIDVSGGARAHLGGYVAVALQAAERLHPDDRLTIVRLDKSARVVCDSVVDGDSEALGKTLRRELAPKAQGSTRPAAFWKLADERVEQAEREGRSCALLLLTDGDNDAPADAPEIGRSIGRLGGRKNLRAALLAGIESGNRAWLEKSLAPLRPRVKPLLGPTELGSDQALAFLKEIGR